MGRVDETTSARAPRASRWRRALQAHFASRLVARIVHGSIIGLALIVVFQAHPPEAGAALATLLGTALVFALAELFSESLATETRTRHHITRAELMEAWEGAVAIAVGVAGPGVFLALAALGVIDLDLALDLAKWSGLALIGGYGFAAARLAGTGTVSSLIHAGAVAAVGGLLIALKALIH